MDTITKDQIQETLPKLTASDLEEISDQIDNLLWDIKLSSPESVEVLKRLSEEALKELGAGLLRGKF